MGGGEIQSAWRRRARATRGHGHGQLLSRGWYRPAVSVLLRGFCSFIGAGGERGCLLQLAFAHSVQRGGVEGEAVTHLSGCRAGTSSGCGRTPSNDLEPSALVGATSHHSLHLQTRGQSFRTPGRQRRPAESQPSGRCLVDAPRGGPTIVFDASTTGGGTFSPLVLVRLASQMRTSRSNGVCGRNTRPASSSS